MSTFLDGVFWIGRGIWDCNKVYYWFAAANQQTARLAGARTVLPSSNPKLEGDQLNSAELSSLASSSAFTTSRYCS